MKNAKKWYQSKAVWGGILAVITAMVNAIIQQFGNIPGLETMLNILTAIAGAFGIYGRVVAKDKIE